MEYSRKHPRGEICPVCGHTGWCSSTLDENYISCNRFDRVHPQPIVHTTTHQATNGRTYLLIKKKKHASSYILIDTTARDDQVQTQAHAIIPDLPSQQLDEAYRKIIAELSWNATDIAWSNKKWGLSEQQCIDLQLRSGDQSRFKLANVLKEMPLEFARVPGLYRYQEGPLKANKMSGIVIPILNHKEEIYGIQMRIKTPGGKYFTWSGAPKTTAIHGTCHAAYGMVKPTTPYMDSSIIITEGIVKAKIASDYIGTKAGFGLLGYSRGEQALGDIMDYIETQKIDHVILAFDNDANEDTKKSVQEAQTDLADQLIAAGLAVSTLVWDGAKGIDDAILAGVDISVVDISKITGDKKIPLAPAVHRSLFKKYQEQHKQLHSSDKTIEEANWETRELIKKTMLTKKMSRVRLLKIDAGVGKTHAMADIIPAMWNNQYQNKDGGTPRILIALADGTKINDFIDMVPLEFHDSMAVYKGRSEANCSEWEKVNKIQSKGHLPSKKVCSSCPFKEECNEVGFYSQFESIKQHPIVLVTHAALRTALVTTTKEQPNRMGSFTHTFIDEDITPQLIQKTTYNDDDLRLYIAKANREKKIFEKKLSDIEDLDADAKAEINFTLKSLNTLAKTLQDMRGILLDASDNITSNRKKINEVFTLPDIKRDLDFLSLWIKQNKGIMGEIKGIEDSFDPDDEADSIPKVGLYHLFHALQEHRLTISNRVFVAFSRRDDLISKLNEGAYLLDATLNQELTGIFKTSTITKISVEDNENLDVQLVAGMPSSMRSLNKKSIADVLIDFGEHEGIKKGSLLTTKSVHERLASDERISEVWDTTGYFGRDHRGSNDFSASTDLTILGSFNPPVDDMILTYEALTGKMVTAEETSIYRYDFCGNMVAKHSSGDNGFDNYYLSLQRAEIYQAIQRIRSKRRQEKMIIRILADPTIWSLDMPEITRTATILQRDQRNKTKNAVRYQKEIKSRNMKAVIKEIFNKCPNEFKESFQSLIEKKGKSTLAAEIATKTNLSARTIMRYFDDQHFWNLIGSEQGTMEEMINLAASTIISLWSKATPAEKWRIDKETYWHDFIDNFL